MATRKQSVSVSMKDKAEKMGISPREAERCVAVTDELDEAMVSALRANKTVSHPIRRQVVTHPIPPFWHGEYLGQMPAVKLLWSNMFFVPHDYLNGNTPRLHQLGTELFSEGVLHDLDSYPGIDKNDPYNFGHCNKPEVTKEGKIVKDDKGHDKYIMDQQTGLPQDFPNCFQMEGSMIEIMCGSENLIPHEKKEERILKPFSLGLNPNLRDRILDVKTRVYFVGYRAPVNADLWPKKGRNGWTHFVRLPFYSFANRVMHPVLATDPKKGFRTPKVPHGLPYLPFFTCTGKITSATDMTRGGIDVSNGISATAYIVGLMYANGECDLFVIPTQAALRILSAMVTYRVHPAFVMMTGGVLQLPEGLIPAEVIGQAAHDRIRDRLLERKNGQKEGPAQTNSRAKPASAPPTQTKGSGGTLADLLKAKNQSLTSGT